MILKLANVGIGRLFGYEFLDHCRYTVGSNQRGISVYVVSDLSVV